jgi:5-methylcytosine-specific restriction endonuclease McrA
MREEHSVRISTRLKLWKQQDKKCAYCGNVIASGKASLDHIIPIIKLDKPLGETNLIVCCKRCNNNKGDHIIFTNLYDGIIYPLIDIPYFFRARYIQTNNKKIDRK